MDDTSNPRPSPPPCLARLGDAPTLVSEEILRGHVEVAIRHNGRLYRLRNTRNGKLILT